MSMKEEITSGQIMEMTKWLTRLSNHEYQKRRTMLRKITDPRAVLPFSLSHPFLTPLRKGFRLQSEGPKCTESIIIRYLDFLTGDVLRLDAAGTGETSTRRFSQHHAEHLLERWKELPRFDDGTKVVFPGTVYIPVKGPEIGFYPCLVWYDGMPKMRITARAVAFASNCWFPYQMHSKR